MLKLKSVLFLVTFAFSLVLSVTARAAVEPAQLVANNHRLAPSAPDIKATSYILLDANTGAVIAEKDADKRLPPASLTKMMTLYVISDALRRGQINIDDEVTISRKAWQMGGSKMFVKVGEKVPVGELLQGIIVASGNDACIAMSEYIAGSEDSFVGLMNHEAEQLGLTNTHFTDCTGMPDPDHYSSARDMAKISQSLINDFPEYYHWYKQQWFTHNGIKQPNRNRLLWRYQAADGLKTGHTDSAGYCLASSAKQEDTRLISVVLGSPSDNARSEGSISLFQYGFRFFKTHKIYQAGQTITDARVWKGAMESVPLSTKEDISLTMPQGQYKKLKVVTVINNPLTAPIYKGEKLGQLQVKYEDEILVDQPLIAMQEVPKGGLWVRFKDSVSMKIHDYLGSDDEESGETSEATS